MKQDNARPDPYGIAEQFLVAHYTQDPESPIAKELWLRWWRGEWLAYQDGAYSSMTADELKAGIVGFLREQNITLSVQYVNAIVLALTHLCLVDSKQELNTWMEGINGAEVITAANGNISLSDRDTDDKPLLLSHAAKYLTLSRLPYPYDPAADCPLWRTFLSDVMLDRQDYILLLQEFLGYLFRRDLREQRFLLCTGPGSNGKGVFAEVVEGVVGPENVSHVPLALFGDKFALHSTVGKRANITSEAIHVIDEQPESILKSFVAGDAMTFERKFRDPVNMLPTAKVIVFTNALPRFSDRTWGLWRRILMVPFDKVVADKDQIKGLATELMKERPGILNWVIEGLGRLNRNGGFAIPQSHAAMLEEYRRDSDPARAFLCETYQASSNGEHIATDRAYTAYRQWCEANGYRPLGERQFGKDVRRIFPGVSRKRAGSRDDRRYVYQGLMDLQSDSLCVPCPVCPVSNRL